MSFKQVHMAALAAALLAGTAGVAYAQSSSPSTAPAKHGASSTTMGASAPSGSAQGATTAVRFPESRLWNTQPTVPSESRIRRQVSYSWMTSIGRPGRVNTQAIL